MLSSFMTRRCGWQTLCVVMAVPQVSYSPKALGPLGQAVNRTLQQREAHLSISHPPPPPPGRLTSSSIQGMAHLPCLVTFL